MKVEILRSTPHDDAWLKPGDTPDVPADLARAWISRGKAKEFVASAATGSAAAAPAAGREGAFLTPPSKKPSPDERSPEAKAPRKT